MFIVELVVANNEMVVSSWNVNDLIVGDALTRNCGEHLKTHGK